MNAQALFMGDRAVLTLDGADARELLQGLITNDLDLVSPTHAIYAALLTPQGKFLFDFFVCEQDGTLMLDCEADRADELLKRLTMYKLRADVNIHRVDGLKVSCVFGEDTLGLMSEDPGTADSAMGGIAFVDPRHAGLGLRIIGEAGSIAEALIAEQVEEGDLADYHKLRIDLCIPFHSSDIEPNRSFILDHNFESLNGVSFSKGCYIGQEIVARMKHRGTSRKAVWRIETESVLPPAEAALTYENQEVGTLLGGSGKVALALVRTDRLPDDIGDKPLRVESNGQVLHLSQPCPQGHRPQNQR